MSLVLLSILITLSACGLSVALTMALMRKHGSRWSDLPFAFVLGLALVYLEVSPSLALVGHSLPGVDGRAADYVRLQIILFLGFVVPFVLVYAWRRPRNPLAGHPQLRRGYARPRWDVLLVLVAVLRLAIAFRYGLWRLRIGDEVVAKTNAVPFAVYSVYRLVVEAQLPLVTVASLRLTRVRTSAARTGFAFFFFVQLLFALLNSRFSILYLFVAGILGLAISYRPRMRATRRVRRTALAALLGIYVLGLAVLQLRASTGGQGGTGAVSLSVVADSQGINRFNCVDLLAAIAPLQRDGAAGIGIWSGQLWNFRRFVDPQGFAAFRERQVTSAKSQLMLRYQGVRQSDYYSCMLTDGYGALGVFGALGLGVVCACALRASRRLIEDTQLMRVFAGVWLAWQLMVFEQEGGSVLFSWPLRLPLLIGLMIAGRLLSPRAVRVVFPVSRPGGPSAPRPTVPAGRP